MNRHSFIVSWAIVACGVWTAAATADWSRFRGPHGTGISTEDTMPPLRWDASANLKWKTALPGPGTSNPVVVGDRVYVTCYSGYGLDRDNPGDINQLKRHLVSIDRGTGKVIWSRTIAAVLPEDPFEGIGVTAHGYASHTPVSDGQNIFVFFGKTGVLAFDRAGTQLWQTSVGLESDRRRWGSASSLLLHKHLVIVPAIAESEALIALDKRTGKQVWRQEAAGLSSSWSTPIIVPLKGGRSDLVIPVNGELWGLNPDTGKLRWYCKTKDGNSVCSSPVAHNGIIYSIEGRSGSAIAVRAGGKGDVTGTHVLWTGKDSSRFSSPLVYQDRVYSFNKDVLNVINAKTGERISRTRLEGYSTHRGRGTDYASPVLAGGRLIFIRDAGDMFVLKPGDKPETMAVNSVTPDSEIFDAGPAISGGELFIRSDKNLYCVADKGQTPAPRPPKDATAAAQDEPGGGERGDRRGGRGRGRGNPEERFKRSDANGDGKLSGDEIPGRMRGALEQLDTDKDGAISLEEYRNGMRNFRRGGGRGGRGGGESREGTPQRPQRPEIES